MDPNIQAIDDQLSYLEESCTNITQDYMSHLLVSVFESEMQNRYNKPLPWIGMYIALASLFCLIAIVADLLHGFRKKKKLWFPCKYFTLNAASLTVIAVAIKLPMDLSNLMLGYVDQTAKIGSLAFMCTMMANLLPSLATLDSKELVSNIIALGLLVITLVVNVCIQLNTGILKYPAFSVSGISSLAYYGSGNNILVTTIYVGMLLMLLMIYLCSSLAIPKSKQILESKYQAAHETSFKEQDLQQPGRLLTFEKLKEHVSKYWIMAHTGSPQFMAACSITTCASGVICALTSIFATLTMIFDMSFLYDIESKRSYESDYKWSVLPIVMIQFLGVGCGTIAPVARCFLALSFKLSVKRTWKHMIKVFKVESYWTQKLSDWKESNIPFPSCSRRWKIVILDLKILIIRICIGFQKTVVVACKIIAVIPNFFVICVVCCFCCWKRLKAAFSALGFVLVQNSEQLGKYKDLSQYVLQLQDDMEFSERTLNSVLKSMNKLIQEGEKKQPNNLMKLLAESRGFEGVEKFDSHHVPPLLSEEYLNCWSLPLVTLTTIAMSLPNIQTNVVDCLLRGVSEGLIYVTLVEENLNDTDDRVSIQKAAKTLWLEVDVYHKWFGNKLRKPATQVNTAAQILQLLRNTAKRMVAEVESMDIGGQNDNSKCRSICANSMYRITETIMLSYHAEIDQVSHKELFAQLSLMIADILAACLTNLPRVIALKCHTNDIKKRVVSVHAAAQLLGETTQIVNTLQQRELPCLNPDELAFIDKWRSYLQDPVP